MNWEKERKGEGTKGKRDKGKEKGRAKRGKSTFWQLLSIPTTIGGTGTCFLWRGTGWYVRGNNVNSLMEEEDLSVFHGEDRLKEAQPSEKHERKDTELLRESFLG